MPKFGYYFEKVNCYLLVFVVVPFYFIGMMTLVRQSLVEIYKPGILKHSCHIALSTYFFINIVGNMLMSITTDCSIKKSYVNGTDYCEKCNIMRPPKSWHCRKCDKCILRRDHHCLLFAKCVGLHNQRYYILFLAHVAVAMAYASIYSYYYVAAKFEEQGVILMAFRVINPTLRYLTDDYLSVRDMYVVFLFLNLSLVLWSSGLFIFHVKNILRGITTHERHEGTLKVFHPRWRDNVEKVLGTNWKMAIFWPFVESPLPNDNLFK